MTFKEKLGKELIIFDGAMGSLLQEKGLGAGELPELWNVTNKDTILDIHRAYLQSGSDVITANTFGANRLKLADTGYTAGEIIAGGVALARQAVRDSGKEAFTALDIGPTGKLLAPFGDLDFEEAVSIYSEMIACGGKAGADVIIIETMTDLYEVKAALLAAKETSSLPVIVSLAFDEHGRLLSGADIPAAVALIEGLGADAMGFNCGIGPEQMKRLLPELLHVCSIPVIIQSNAGLPRIENGKTVYNVGPEEFSDEMADMPGMGVSIIGGCCGTTPAHIEAVARKCRTKKLNPVTPKNLTVLSSYSKAVEFGEGALIIGERINPTGKPLLKQALRDKNMGYLYGEAIDQIERGAHILDINVGMPDIDEAETLELAVKGLQSVTHTPLQIDTSDTEAMERAMRIYSGKPLVNSVNGKEEVMEAIFPLIKKYGGVVVALTLDEAGIPDTARGRIAIAENLVKRAESYGISKKDIIIDPLVLPVSTGAENAQITLDALEYIRNTMGMHTVLGVSNISFGLPQRENMNAAFFTLAMDRGLSAGIVNPGGQAEMNAYYSHLALSGGDKDFAGYIGRFSQNKEREAKPAEKNMSLGEAITKGLSEKAASSARSMLSEAKPLEIINSEIVPALDEVGKGFETNKIFLPELLSAANAAKAAFEVLKEYMAKSGLAGEIKGKIVLATVKGDIHDIGKNIVKVLLENYNYDVIDLGKDVAPELIAETVVRDRVRLAGLSALMTTTVPGMEATIKLLREKAPECKIMVGGAVLTQEVADRIGADFYSKDAMGSIYYANSLNLQE